MDPVPPEQLRDDLAPQLAGELLLDDLSRALYATDASLFEVTPLGVVTPRDEADVRALVRFAAEHQLPLTPRGAGTGLAGAALGPGLVVDFSRHCRTILDTGPDWVRGRCSSATRRRAPTPHTRRPTGKATNCRWTRRSPTGMSDHA